jgi:perosamine synthetase
MSPELKAECWQNRAVLREAPRKFTDLQIRVNAQNPPMQSERSISRRRFIASTAALAAVSQLPAAETDPNALAMNGGAKTVKARVPKLVRWGDAERNNLNEMIGQDTLFYWHGPQTTALIERVKKWVPSKWVMTCSSGTAAIHAAIGAAGIAPGDEVITTPITDIGSTIGILFQQAVPVFADLQPHTYNLDPAAVERAITPKTKAILAVHLSGNPCRLKELKQIADAHKLVLIEDCAQAWGAKYNGQPIGTIGHIACFSFQNTKQVTCGDGGVIASNDERFGPLIQPFADKGTNRSNPKDGYKGLATNYRMSEPQAAVAAAQLDRLENIALKRSQLGRTLSEQLTGIPGIVPHELAPEDRCTHYLYFFRMDPKKLKCSRTQLIAALHAEGAQVSPGYIPELIHEMPMFQKHAFFAGRWPVKEFGLTQMDYTKVTCPVASDILNTCVRVQLHEAMSEDYIRQVAAAVRKVATHYAV